MISRFSIVLNIWLVVASLSMSAFGQPWHETEPAKCDTVSADFTTMEIINTMFPRKLPVRGNPLTVMYLEWPSDDYRAIQSSPGHSKLRNDHPLTASERDILKQRFTSLGSGIKIPWYVNVATAAATWMVPDSLSKTLFRGTKTLFKAILAESAGKQLGALEMAAVFADGGLLREVITADEPTAGKPYLSDAVIYQVKVGNEVRNYPILSCTYAVKLELSAKPGH